MHVLGEKYFPEKRLFLRTATDARFVRLSPSIQIIAISGTCAFVGWSIVATAIVLLDTIGSGNFRDQARRNQFIYEERLNSLASERDTRAIEALAAQDRFSTALTQVSDMQSELLSSEEQRTELERGIAVMQSTLRRTIVERDNARNKMIELAATLNTSDGLMRPENAAVEVAATLSYLNDTLKNTAQERDQAELVGAKSKENMASLELELQFLEEKTNQIFRQLEEAMTISVEPLDKMFRNAGLNTKRLLEQVRSGYSGQGGPLSPISFRSKGLETLDPTTRRANNILSQLDKLNIYRIAAEKAPFSMPVKGSFRFTSGYGPRWGKMHRGVDFAAKARSPIYATAEGVVTEAAWGSGYGRAVYVKHAFGIETRYAHLAKIRVKKGQRVSRGQRIGDMGSSGRSTGTHLHYEIRVNGKDVNPMTYIKAGRNVF
jgi:murein DD-endopeptidase MepM/ murein hydrolase activator NlpD